MTGVRRVARKTKADGWQAKCEECAEGYCQTYDDRPDAVEAVRAHKATHWPSPTQMGLRATEENTTPRREIHRSIIFVNGSRRTGAR